jgi:hypothetical protein
MDDIGLKLREPRSERAHCANVRQFVPLDLHTGVGHAIPIGTVIPGATLVVKYARDPVSALGKRSSEASALDRSATFDLCVRIDHYDGQRPLVHFWHHGSEMIVPQRSSRACHN